MKRSRPAWVRLITIFTTVTSTLGLVSLIVVYADVYPLTRAYRPPLGAAQFSIGCAIAVTALSAGIALYRLSRWAAHLFLASLVLYSYNCMSFFLSGGRLINVAN